MNADESSVVETELVVRVKNNRTLPVELIVEPWGRAYPMVPGQMYEVVVRGPAGNAPEVDIEDYAIVVWIWSGSTARVLLDGKDMDRAPMPQVPPGLYLIRPLIEDVHPPRTEPPSVPNG